MPPSAASLIRARASNRFAEAVREGLTAIPRRIPAEFFYDALGSALFEAIGELPWYPITRAETSLLNAHGREIAAAAGAPATIIELGPGNGSKLAMLLDAFAAVHGVAVHLVDVSQSALDAASQALHTHAQAARPIVLVPHRMTYEEGACEALAERDEEGRALTIFLGSNIGNFDREAAAALLHSLRRAHRAGDRLLVGVDLIKSEPEMLLAYDDPLGVTAAFNRNLLVRANRELGANFAIETFAHRAVWNADEARMESYLVSVARQRVRIPASGLEVAFEAGDTIWTESSHKYTADGIVALLAAAGFGFVRQWTGHGFALTLVETV